MNGERTPGEAVVVVGRWYSLTSPKPSPRAQMGYRAEWRGDRTKRGVVTVFGKRRGLTSSQASPGVSENVF